MSAQSIYFPSLLANSIWFRRLESFYLFWWLTNCYGLCGLSLYVVQAWIEVFRARPGHQISSHFFYWLRLRSVLWWSTEDERSILENTTSASKRKCRFHIIWVNDVNVIKNVERVIIWHSGGEERQNDLLLLESARNYEDLESDTLECANRRTSLWSAKARAKFAPKCVKFVKWENKRNKEVPKIVLQLCNHHFHYAYF